jgi:hypothetical protein
MFTWFTNWLRGRGRKRQRQLFEFFDGSRFRLADPWPIYRQLYNDDEFVIGSGPEDPASMLLAAIELQEPEFSKAVACGHRAFGTKPFDGRSGLTEGEVVNLIADFIEWCDALVKKNVGLPISSPPTGSASSTGPACQAGPTNCSLPSASSPTESIPESPLSSSPA